MTKTKARYGVCLILLLVLVLLCAGCSTADKSTQTQTQKDAVYIIYGNGITTSEWKLQYGVVSRDGEMILPLEQRQVYVINDEKTGEQLGLQTREQYVDDPNLTAEKLYEDNNWEHIHSNYTLYDLQGNLVQELGERAVQTVYDHWVLYSDGKLENRIDGAVLFDDVNAFYAADGYCMLICQDYSKVRVTDDNMQVLWEREGSGDISQAGKEIIWRQEDGAVGVVGLDGAERLPCQYDSIWCSNDSGNCIVRQGDYSAVVSLQDGHVLYEITEPDKEVCYANDTVLLLRTWKTDAAGERDTQVQMYDYAGNAISDTYHYISSEAEDMLPGETAVFHAETMDDVPVLLNQQGQEIYRGQAGTWLNPVTADRIIVTENDKAENSATWQTLDGQVLNQKDYQGMHPDYLPVKGYPYSRKSSLVMAYYNFGNTFLWDVLDVDGNILVEQAKSIRALDQDRFWVEKGFSQGLMDAEGNWLYQQSLFDATVDA